MERRCTHRNQSHFNSDHHLVLCHFLKKGMFQLVASDQCFPTRDQCVDEGQWTGKRERSVSSPQRFKKQKCGQCYSRLCLETPVLCHVIGRNVALKLLTQAGSLLLQMSGQPPALMRSVQNLEFVTRAEAQVLCGTGLVVKQSHKVVATAPLGLL